MQSLGNPSSSIAPALRSKAAVITLFVALFFSAGALYTFGAAIGSALFISSMAAEDVPKGLPWVYVGASLAQVGTALIYDRLLARTTRIGALVVMQLAMASVLTLLMLVPLSPIARSYLLTIILDAIGLFSIQLFFGLAGDVFSAAEARKNYVVLAVAMAVGTLLGGHALTVLIPLLGVQDLVYVCAAMVLLDLLLCTAVAAPQPAHERPAKSRVAYRGAALGELAESKLVRAIWAVFLLSILLTATATYQLSWLASRLPRAELATFFARFYEAVGIGELVLLALLSPLALRKMSVPGVLMLLPCAVGGLSAAAWVVALTGGSPAVVLGFSAAVNAVRLMLEETLSLPARELLFLPLPLRLRLRAQVWAGAVLAPAARGASGFVLALCAITGLAQSGLSLFILGWSLALLVTLARMRAPYGEALRAASVQLRPTLTGDVLTHAKVLSDRPSAAPGPQRT